MTEILVGKLLDETARRDAIHFALAPVTADTKLFPGQRIGFVEGSKERVCAALDTVESVKCLGIVDPFLPNFVQEDQRFWMFLLPNTVSGMRHQWEHPAFDEERRSVSIQKKSSEDRIREIADSVGVSYGRLMESANRYLDTGDYLCGGYEMEGESTPEDFWTHFHIVTGRKVENVNGNFFTCAC